MKKKQYIGEQVIKETSVHALGYIIVDFIDNDKQGVYSQEIFDLIVSDAKTDAQSVRVKKAEYLTGKILELFLHHNIPYNDIELILSKLQGSIEVGFEEALNKLWGCDRFERTFLESHQILLDKS